MWLDPANEVDVQEGAEMEVRLVLSASATFIPFSALTHPS